MAQLNTLGDTAPVALPNINFGNPAGYVRNRGVILPNLVSGAESVGQLATLGGRVGAENARNELTRQSSLSDLQTLATTTAAKIAQSQLATKESLSRLDLVDLQHDSIAADLKASQKKAELERATKEAQLDQQSQQLAAIAAASQGGSMVAGALGAASPAEAPPAPAPLPSLSQGAAPPLVSRPITPTPLTSLGAGSMASGAAQAPLPALQAPNTSTGTETLPALAANALPALAVNAPHGTSSLIVGQPTAPAQAPASPLQRIVESFKAATGAPPTPEQVTAIASAGLDPLRQAQIQHDQALAIGEVSKAKYWENRGQAALQNSESLAKKYGGIAQTKAVLTKLGIPLENVLDRDRMAQDAANGALIDKDAYIDADLVKEQVDAANARADAAKGAKDKAAAERLSLTEENKLLDFANRQKVDTTKFTDESGHIIDPVGLRAALTAQIEKAGVLTGTAAAVDPSRAQVVNFMNDRTAPAPAPQAAGATSPSKVSPAALLDYLTTPTAK